MRHRSEVENRALSQSEISQAAEEKHIINISERTTFNKDMSNSGEVSDPLISGSNYLPQVEDKMRLS